MSKSKYDPESDFAKQYEDKLAHQKRPTILVAGYTGAGKTTLIQSICGKEVVPDCRIGAGLPQTQDFNFYENALIRFWDSKGLEPGDSEKGFIERTNAFVRRLQDDANVDNHIHLAWYTIQGPGARVTPCDLRLIKEIFPNVLVLITKADITKPRQKADMIEVLLNEGLPESRILLSSENDEVSLKKVVNVSYELLPEAYRDAFVSAQRIDFDTKRLRGQIAIHSAAAAAAAAGAFPLPVSDALVITPIQVGLVASLAIIFGEDIERLRIALAPILLQEVGVLTASSLTKMVPGLGSVIQATVAAGLTEALGQLLFEYLVRRSKARLEARVPPELSFDWGMFIKLFKDARNRRFETVGAPPN